MKGQQREMAAVLYVGIKPIQDGRLAPANFPPSHFGIDVS